MKSICKAVFLMIVAIAVLSCQKEEGSVDEWNWEFLGKPMGDSEVYTITIHPEDDGLWFVTSGRGIYVTRNGGSSWENHFTGFTPALEIDPNDPSSIFVGSETEMYLSIDYGQNWRHISSFQKYIQSILISEIDNSVYVGLRWEDSEIANGIFKSNDMGETWVHYSYNVDAKGLIPWDIEEDSENQKLYIATEIYDHPQPYHPPFLRSSDGGITWEDISGSLPWHAIKIQVHPLTHDVYVLTEGPGLYYSSDFGDHWQYLGNQFWLEFIIDQNNPQRFWGGNHTSNQSSGGVFLSNDGGNNFEFIGLYGHIVSSLCLDGNSASLYVASYGSGIFILK
ncbi:WD40/YVTN/BNR-like repeat-containing protein [Bacteroidota bacterium]